MRLFGSLVRSAPGAVAHRDGSARGGVDGTRAGDGGRRLQATDQWNRLAPVLERNEVPLCPTMRVGAMPCGKTESDHDVDDTDGRFLGLDLTSPFNLVSLCPVLSVPSGFTRAGLPTGMQIVGRRYDDRTVLEIGAAVEELRP